MNNNNIQYNNNRKMLLFIFYSNHTTETYRGMFPCFLGGLLWLLF